MEPLSDKIKAFKDEVKELCPKAVIQIVATNPIDEDNCELIYEQVGSEEMIQSAFIECMHKTEAAVRFMNRILLGFSEECLPEESERCVTALQDIISRIRRSSSKTTILARLRAEQKRLKKSGRSDLYAAKTAEISALEKEIQEDLSKERRKYATKQKRCESLKIARQALAEKRDRIRKQEEARKNAKPQFQPYKSAKKRMQQIAERQAARKKKKASSDGSTPIYKSPMFRH